MSSPYNNFQSSKFEKFSREMILLDDVRRSRIANAASVCCRHMHSRAGVSLLI